MAHSYQQIRKVELKTCNLICYAEQTIENWLVETTISNTCRRCHIYPLRCDAYYLDLLMYVCRSANEHRTVGRQCLQGSNPLGVSFFAFHKLALRCTRWPCLTLAWLFVKGRLNQVALGWNGRRIHLCCARLQHGRCWEHWCQSGCGGVTSVLTASLNRVASRRNWLVWVWEFAEVDITEFIIWYIPCTSVILS